MAFRAGLGLAGSGINWGAVGEIGYAARHGVAGANVAGTIPIEQTIAVIDASARMSGNYAAVPAFMGNVPKTHWQAGLSNRFKDNMTSRIAASRQLEQKKEAQEQFEAMIASGQPIPGMPGGPGMPASNSTQEMPVEIDVFNRAVDARRAAWTSLGSSAVSIRTLDQEVS